MSVYTPVRMREVGDIAACRPSPTDCRKDNCYTCGRIGGIKHRGGSGPNGELLMRDVLTFWWNHNWITFRAENGCWVRQFPGGISELVEAFTPDPSDRTGRRKVRA